MKKSFKSLTTAQFAKLHGVNKRMLHYYDDIGLFSPRAKGENGYRFYDAAQSLDFEYIRMLKELNMSIDEIAAYCKAPTPARFLEIASAKEEEIGRQIKKLRHAQKVLRAKREQAAFCGELREREIRIEACRAERLLVLPYDFAEDDMQRVFAHAKEKWSIEQIRMGIGGFISLDKVYGGNFEAYDGIYTPALSSASAADSLTRPKGNYLCGYQKGVWSRLPLLYEAMTEYAEQNGLTLSGYAYEVGMNEFMISAPDEYITKVMILIQENV